MRLRQLYAVLALSASPWLAQADLEAGYAAYQREDYQAAAAAWRPLAEQGDMVAQFNLGQMYRLGKGLAQSDQEAVKWYVLAARQGLPEAQRNLKLMYRDGRASESDYEAAFGAGAKTAPAVAAAPAKQPSKPETNQPDTATIQATAAKQAADWAKPQPAPAAAAPAASASAAKKPSTPVEPTQTTAALKPAEGDGWLKQLNPQAYLVQIMAAPDRESVDAFLKANGARLPAPAQPARTWAKGREWHVLLMGPFTAHGEAQDAIDQLPNKIRKNRPWARRVSAIQALTQQ